MSIATTAHAFFQACDTGAGWAECAQYCTADAGFSCQADALAEITTVEAYCEWMKGLLVPLPDARYELKAFSADEDRKVVTAFAVFHGTHTGEGPIPATSKATASDYVYAMQFEGDKISHVTKIWNDLQALKELGWA